MSSMRVAGWALIGAGALLAATLVAGAWLLGTEPGAAWVVQRALARAAPTVAVGRVRGSLLRGLVLEDLRVRSARDELDVARLALDWGPSALLARTLAFERVAAGAVAYRSVGGASGTAVLPALPFVLRLDSVTIDALTIESGGAVLELGRTRLAATLDGTRLTIRSAATATQGFALAGDADLDFAAGLRVHTTVQWSGPVAATPAAGSLVLEGSWPTFAVRHELTAPFAASASGTLNLAQPLGADLVLEWRDLAWPGVEGIGSPNGRMTLAGTLADYRYEAAGALAVAGRDATFTVRGGGSGARLALAALQIEARTAAGAGRIAATGDVDLGARTARLAVTASDVDPSWWAADWPGRLRGTFGLRAGAAPATMAFDGVDVAGTLRGYRLSLRGDAEYAAPDRWRLTGVRLASGANRVALDGALTDGGIELAADVDVANLDLVWPGLRGSAAGKVDLGGSLDRPRARGRLVSRGLAFRDFTLERLEVEGGIGGDPSAPLALRFDATGLARGPVRVEHAAAVANGTTAAHRLNLDLTAAEWHAHAEADGGFAARVWRGTLTRAEFDEDLLGQWLLVEPAAIALGAHEASLATTCLNHAHGGRWCAQLDLRGRPADRLALAAQNFELETLRPLLPPALALEGVYQLSASLFDLTGNPRGALVLTGEKTRVRATTGERQSYATGIDELRAAATLGNGRLELQAALRSGDAGKLDLTAAIRDVRLPDSRIEGTLSLAWPDVAFLALLGPELGQVGGSVTGALTVAGTVQEPELDGRAVWQGGRVAVPQWGLVVEGIEATATSHGGRAVAFDASGRVGDGTLTLSGQTELDPQAGWPTRLNLRGDSVRAVHLAEAEIFVTPDLTAAVTWPDVRVTGTVKVPRASLGLSALPAQAVAPSPDAVVHGREGPRSVRRSQLHAAVDLELGDDVRYSGLDLDAKVTGSLHVDAEPGRSAIATGTLTLTGTYDAYGQQLTLERGQLLFSGPLDDPGVDVRAVRAIDTTRVGVELAGTVKSPRTRVFSTPTMSEADALSYLLLGRPVTGNGTQETATLQTAAIAMGLNQALPVVQRLGATLGLDELSVQTTATDAGALMAGKYLSPKLYIRYSYGLFNRIGGLLLRFKFNERMSIETRSGDQKSMDLLYTVEKD